MDLVDEETTMTMRRIQMLAVAAVAVAAVTVVSLTGGSAAGTHEMPGGSTMRDGTSSHTMPDGTTMPGMEMGR